MRFCDWLGCSEQGESVLPIVHVDTETRKHYCDEHSPGPDGETWRVP